LEEQFGFLALSATNVAAPNFAAAAIGIDITRPITIEGQSLSLARLDISPKSDLAGRAVAEIEQIYDVSVVLLRHDAKPDFHPAGDRRVVADDVLAVLAGPDQVGRLIEDNNRR
jgi:hypothetical protein